MTLMGNWNQKKMGHTEPQPYNNFCSFRIFELRVEVRPIFLIIGSITKTQYWSGYDYTLFFKWIH